MDLVYMWKELSERESWMRNEIYEGWSWEWWGEASWAQPKRNEVDSIKFFGCNISIQACRKNLCCFCCLFWCIMMEWEIFPPTLTVLAQPKKSTKTHHTTYCWCISYIFWNSNHHSADCTRGWSFKRENTMSKDPVSTKYISCINILYGRIYFSFEV